ncbi:MAG: 4Fe-4S binding protein [Clostridia bacterium]|nr:4Fe-4S binding protein [Clostridia bacterium]
MSIIQLKEANCKNCYKCIRHCEVKSISFHDDQARILEDECVLCGKCTLICPQNAKQIASDLDKVKAWLANGEEVCVSLAPSIVGAFKGISFSQLAGAFKALGFARVEETAIGATEVSKAYARVAASGTLPNLITTCCPSVVLLVEKYFPELLPQLAQVPSPAVTHAQQMKAAYGDKIKTVFIGPCISKKAEALRSKAMDEVLLYDEVREWIEQERVPFTASPEPEMHQTLSRVYPVPGGILKTLPADCRQQYKAVAVDGLDRCIQTLKTIREHKISGYILEMSSCVDSCMGGPGMHEQAAPFLLGKSDVYAFSRKKTLTPAPDTEGLQVNMAAVYGQPLPAKAAPTQAEIWEILNSIGKHHPKDLLNCGACGYDTCWAKAVAVYEGKASLRMCLPYMREKAESMSNTILDNTPNALFLLDQAFNIIQYNKAGETLLSMDSQCIGLPMADFLDMSVFESIKTTGQPVMGVRCRTAIYDLLVEQSIVPVPNQDYLVMVKDISSEEENLKALAQMREETLQTAQQVIDKQMRVAQEIASLLGETTGETKAALLKLKASITKGGL